MPMVLNRGHYDAYIYICDLRISLSNMHIESGDVRAEIASMMDAFLFSATDEDDRKEKVTK